MNWSSPEGGKGEIILTFSDMATGTVITEPIQVEVHRESNPFGIFVVRDGILIMKKIPRRMKNRLNITSYFYRYRFEITSMRYKSKYIICEFEKHKKEVRFDIALEPKYQYDDTRIY
jgi:hypothetical protein